MRHGGGDVGNGTRLLDVPLGLTATGVNPLDTTPTTGAQADARYCYTSSRPDRIEQCPWQVDSAKPKSLGGMHVPRCRVGGGAG
jgi:hypothetical protein